MKRIHSSAIFTFMAPRLPLISRGAIALAIILLVSSSASCQKTPPQKPVAGTGSIGDAVQAEDQTAASHQRGENVPSTAQPVAGTRHIHILYMHGISQVGAGDSLLLRKGICKHLGKCSVISLGRMYADGPFSVDQAPPTLAYMGDRIWKSQEEWNASAPFVDRYDITGKGHTPILLDEFNWWPLVYPLKCKWLIPRESRMTGPSKAQLDICATPTTPDPAHQQRFLSYQWIQGSEASELHSISRRATTLNRSLKNGLMDWGFADAVLALGPMQEVLTAGVRELLIKSLQSYARNLKISEGEDVDAEVFFVAHSLGSYLALTACNSDLLGSQDPELSNFQITPQQRQAADYFSAHTAGFYFLANQIALLELARVSAPTSGNGDTCASTSGGKSVQSSIVHWSCQRQLYLKQRTSVAPEPQIIAWNDPGDLLSWEVPEIEGVHVVNIPVHNSGFKLSPFIESPTDAHANYARNQEVLRLILKPSPGH